MILEYKMVREMDVTRTPSWIEDGGYFRKSDNTLIGWSPAKADRKYYIPDTVVTLTNEQLIARVIAISKNLPNETDNEKVTRATASANAWIAART